MCPVRRVGVNGREQRRAHRTINKEQGPQLCPAPKEFSVNQTGILSTVSYQQRMLWPNSLGFYLAAVVFAAGNLVLPMAVHAIPNGGVIFLPLFFFTLVAAWRYGWLAGLLVATASPLLNHLLNGMPALAMLPAVLFKSWFLAVAATLVAARVRRLGLGWLALVAVLAQLAGAAFDALVSGNVMRSLNGLWMGLPGVALMVFGGYAVLRLLDRREEDAR